MLIRAALAIVLLLPTVAVAEISVPPDNVRDPAKSNDAKSDPALPYIHLEPHDFCYDLAGPMKVTVHAVNGSGRALTLDWRPILESLSLEAIGPGRAAPQRTRGGDRVTIETNESGSVTIDLKERFKIEGASVYRLVFARPLDDGRVHIASAAQFVIEDDAALAKLEGVGTLLKDNPLFAAGGPPRRDWDDLGKGRGAAPAGKWDTALAAASQQWKTGIERADARTLEALLDRVLLLSDGFRIEPDQQFVNDVDNRVANHLAVKDRERFYLKIVRTHSKPAVMRSINRLMILRSDAALDEFFRLVSGPHRDVAIDAISSLSNYNPQPKITRFLQRVMAGDNRELALEAAIVSCYAGDWSGIGMMLRCATSDDATLRLKAIAQCVDDRFRRYRAKIVPILLGELKKPLNDETLERAIESLGTYPSAQALRAVEPFLKHKNPQVSQRAQLTISAMHRAGVTSSAKE